MSLETVRSSVPYIDSPVTWNQVRLRNGGRILYIVALNCDSTGSNSVMGSLKRGANRTDSLPSA